MIDSPHKLPNVFHHHLRGHTTPDVLHRNLPARIERSLSSKDPGSASSLRSYLLPSGLPRPSYCSKRLSQLVLAPEAVASVAFVDNEHHTVLEEDGPSR